MTEHRTISISISINLTEHGTRGRVYIDGSEIEGVRGFTLSAFAGDVARLDLDLITYEAEVDGELRVMVPEVTSKALSKLGWTPPGGTAPTDDTPGAS
jgi:hypothetical protein